MRRYFSKQEDQFILENYTSIPAKRIAKLLGRSESTARQRMKALGLIVPQDIIQKFKQESRFKKGYSSSK